MGVVVINAPHEIIILFHAYRPSVRGDSKIYRGAVTYVTLRSNSDIAKALEP